MRYLIPRYITSCSSWSNYEKQVPPVQAIPLQLKYICPAFWFRNSVINCTYMIDCVRYISYSVGVVFVLQLSLWDMYYGTIAECMCEWNHRNVHCTAHGICFRIHIAQGEVGLIGFEDLLFWTHLSDMYLHSAWWWIYTLFTQSMGHPQYTTS